ncbi:MAG: response regulator [Flavobacteriales bacterium]|nr:response regulator [Flavobacteriales bacterium]
MIIWISISVILLITLVITVIIFSRKKSELQRELSQLNNEHEQLREQMLEHERYLAYTSHELRTPLNAISGGTQLLSKTAMDERQKKYLNTIQSAVDSALLIVNDILDLAKLDSNMVEVRPVDFIFTEVINGIRHILEFRAEQKGLQFIVELDEKIPPIVKGDSKHLTQILLNLATNAVKFTDLGKVVIRAKLLSEKDQSVVIRFEVEDTGKGIRKSSLSTIFNQYEQETRHTIKHSGGTGLGLAITRKLVELQHGEISVDSKYLEGTTFTVDLPFEKSQGIVQSHRESDESLYQPLSGIQILAVDDNLINREILFDLLKDANPYMQIDLAVDGEDAVLKAKEKKYDVILMDLQMPKKNGYEATEYIRKNLKYPHCDVPIIAMTAHALENVAESCFKAGMNDYISKPIDMNFLGNKLKKIIDKKVKLSDKFTRFKTVDLEHLQELTKDNKDRILKYINIFLSNLPDELEILKKHGEAKDFKSIRESLHKIKGIVAYMGIKSLTRLFSSAEYVNLETLGDEALKNFFNEIEETCYRAIDELKVIQNEI